jgi:RNA polymerase sigma-70 factor, ECF subfamily
VTDSNVNKGRGSQGTSSSLLDRVRAQDRAAWERLVGLYAPLVYQWCRKAGLRSEDAEDVGQDVFTAVYRSVGEFRRDRGETSFRRWLHVITLNKIRDFGRQFGGEVGQGGSDAQRLMQAATVAENKPDAPADPTELVHLAHQALEILRDEFGPEKWQIFYRVVIEGHRAGDVAAELGVSANQVYLTKSRWLRRLRDEFAGLLDVDEM